VEASLEKADGEAGDAVKYKASLSQMAHRWQLFSALYGIEETAEPTQERIQLFTAFMYK